MGFVVFQPLKTLEAYRHWTTFPSKPRAFFVTEDALLFTTAVGSEDAAEGTRQGSGREEPEENPRQRMDPTTCQQPSSAISFSQPLRCSLLTGNVDWTPHNLAFGQQPDAPHRMPWIRQNPRIVKFTDVRPSRCRSSSLAFKRHLESRDQEPNSKHFLSEDKMAARFNSLSLDNDHIYSSNGFPIQDEDPRWQQAYTRLKELQQRLSQDGGNDDISSTEEENELNGVVVDGEFFMTDCPLLTHPLNVEAREGVSEEMLLSLTTSREVVLWSPPNTSLLCTIRALMATTPSLDFSVQPQQKQGATQEEMEI